MTKYILLPLSQVRGVGWQYHWTCWHPQDILYAQDNEQLCQVECQQKGGCVVIRARCELSVLGQEHVFKFDRSRTRAHCDASILWCKFIHHKMLVSQALVSDCSSIISAVCFIALWLERVVTLSRFNLNAPQLHNHNKLLFYLYHLYNIQTSKVLDFNIYIFVKTK